VLLLLLPAAAGAEEAGLKKATFIPQWVPQAQFAGYYTALDKGIYRKHGIDLEILPGGPDHPSDAAIENGQADFGTLWLSTSIPMRAEGVPIINLAQIMQHSALMLVAKKSSGILEPRDMNGKKVGLWGPIFQIQPRAFFEKYDLDVQVVRQSYSVNLFLRNGVDVASAMWYNEYHTILNCGLNPEELTTFFFHEHGLNFPEDGIYALEATRDRDPELCRAFVQASIEGWEYAFDHPTEALDIVMANLKRAHVPATRVHQRWMLERMRDLIRPEGSTVPVGTLKREDYRRVAEGLMENGMIETIPPFETFYRSCTGHAEK
jgi:NitT/TauT family transport system substrate-binding protein